jgi:hypothetical protein
MEDFEASELECPSIQLPAGVDNECELTEGGTGASGRGRVGRGGAHNPSQPKIRGPNWTEAESLVLIEQKRLENEERQRNRRTEKFVYGKDAWRKIVAGCNAVPGFRERDADQITNKWDTVTKEFKKLKDHLVSSGGASEWWALSKLEKKDFSKIQKLPLEFTEAMYNGLDSWYGQRPIHSAMNVVDTHRIAPTVPNRIGRGATTSAPKMQPLGAVSNADSPSATTPSAPGTRSSTTPSKSPDNTTLVDRPLSSSGRKRKNCGTDNLIDFVKDFHHDHMARVEVQEVEKRPSRSNIPAPETKREARVAVKETTSIISMEERLYELEVRKTRMEERLYELEAQKTANMGNMTSALLMMASSMQTLTR